MRLRGKTLCQVFAEEELKMKPKPKTKRMTRGLALPRELNQAAEAHCRAKDTTFSAWVRRLIREALEEEAT